MFIRLLLLFALFVAGEGCRPAEAPAPLRSNALQPSIVPSTTLPSPSEVLGVLQSPYYPMTETMNTDSEDISPPNLMLIDPLVFGYVSCRDGVVTEVSERDGETLKIHRSMKWFRIRSDVDRAVLMINRHGDDQSNAAIGLFVQDWTYAEMAKLKSLAESIPWAELLEPTGGDINGAHVEMRYKSGSTMVDHGFNSYNWDFIESIWPLLSWIQARQVEILNKRPLAGLRIAVEARPAPQKPGEYTLHVIFHNPGTHPVLFHDPRRPPLPGADATPRLRLQVAPKTDYPIPRWVDMILPPAPDGAPAMMILPGGSRFELQSTWKPEPGSYFLWAKWIDYEPPIEGVEHAPIMPMPADLDEQLPELKAPYPLMGGAFAGGTVVVPHASTR